MPKEIQLSLLKREDDDDELNEELENLIEKYFKKSEEIEKRESKVLQQVELLQSALTSLQAWKDSRKTFMTFSESEIEEESKKIKEETQRIQQEIKKKTEENQKLEEEIHRRKMSKTESQFDSVDSVFQKTVEEDKRVEKGRKEEIETRTSEKELDLEPPPLKEKLLKLEEMEKKLKKELMQESEEFKKKKNSLNEKIALLEWESIVHKKFVENLKKQNEEENIYANH